MATLYNIIEFLCARDGIKPGKLCAEIGISRGVLSDLKAGRSKSLSLATMQKIANYFQVSTDIFSEGVIEETLPNAADMEHLRDTLLKDAFFNKKAPTPVSEDRPTYPPEYDLLSPEDKTLVDNMIRSLARAKQPYPPQDKADEDIDREVEDYRRRLILEKKQRDTSSPSSEAGGETA